MSASRPSAGSVSVADFRLENLSAASTAQSRAGIAMLTSLGHGVFAYIYVGEVPVAERFHHRLARRALPDKSDSQVIEAHVPIVAFFYEQSFAPATGHLGRLGTPPARTGGIA